MSSARRKRTWRFAIALAILAAIGYFSAGTIHKLLTTVSTDDAYVNSHVTLVAARVPGQVLEVLVDDNNRVNQGDVIVELDREPYEVERNLKAAAVELAEAELSVTENQVRAIAAQLRGNRFKLQHAMELVDDQIAQLKAAVATYESQKATLELAQADIKRAEKLLPAKTISQAEFDQRVQQYKVGEAQVKQALEQVHKIRVSLGLTPDSKSGDLAHVPPDLDQNFSSVRQALAELLESGAPLGLFPPSYDITPRKMVQEFFKRDPDGNLDRIYSKLIDNAPLTRQAQSKLDQAKRDLDQAELNLRYCTVRAEIDGVVTRRNVNRGNNVQAGQSLMAIRSLKEIWIDANFKETQLADLRIGHRVELDVDMYGQKKLFAGRITGFTMGTGSTLALLPAQNATGNFIKVVQRLPVRIELTDYEPDTQPLFVGLSVVPYVFVNEAPSGPDAGKVLQPHLVTQAPSAKTAVASGGAGHEHGRRPRALRPRPPFRWPGAKSIRG